MVEVIRIDQEEKDFGERCRIALEKSFGMPIPMPKYVSKRQNRF